MTSQKASAGVRAVLLALGLVWLGGCSGMALLFYRQQVTTDERDRGITAHLQSVPGTLVDGGGSPLRPERPYQFTYEYRSPEGQRFTGSVIVRADRLSMFGLTPVEARWLFARHRPWTVEYDSRDPAISRLQGMSYRGGNSPAVLWGGTAVLGLIGVVGFLLFSGGAILPRRRKRAARTWLPPGMD